MITSLVRIVTGTSILMASAAAQQPVASTEPPLGRGAYIGGAPQEMSAEETAKQLANPNTPLASLTLKNQWTHWNGDLPGSGDIDSQTFLFQPSFPFPINDTDSIFLRPAFPFLLDQPVVDSTGNVRTESGFGDMGLDLAFGRTSKTGVLTAVGIVAGIPIGSQSLSGDTWTVGPELFYGRISKAGVLGVFTNHQWDASGPRETSLTTIQPIATFLPGGGWAVGTAGSMTYNWVAAQWTIPLQLQVSKTVKLGKLPVKVAMEASYYLEKSSALGQDWMIGFNLTPVVPNVVAKWLSGK